LPLRDVVSNRFRSLFVLLTSVLVGAGSPAKAADQLIVRLDGFSLPIDIGQLEAWSRDPSVRSNDLGVWFELLDPRSREDLRRLMRTPILEERDLALQLIQSWAGTARSRLKGVTGSGRCSRPRRVLTSSTPLPL
jgi:hypothetical protein